MAPGVGEAGFCKMGWVKISEGVGEALLGNKCQAIKKSATAALINNRKEARVSISTLLG